MSARILPALAVGTLAAVVLAGCVVQLPAPAAAPAPSPVASAPHLEQHGEVAEHWDEIPDEVMGDASIMMTFTDLPDDTTWDAMLDLELETGEALVAAGVGYLDGNGSDGVVYDVFFYGVDHEAMWDVIEPMYADAPVAWSSVAMWDSFEASEPVVEIVR